MNTLGDALFSNSTQAILGRLFLLPDSMHLRALMSRTGISSPRSDRGSSGGRNRC